MTEQIDLDDMDAAEEQDDEEARPNRGDWFWKGEGDPDDEPGAGAWRGGAGESDADARAESGSDAADATTPVGTAADVAGTGTEGPDAASPDEDEDSASTSGESDADADIGADAESGTEPHRPTAAPHVPSDTEGSPAGIPVSQGGGGAGSGTSSETTGDASDSADAESGGSETSSRASGPHGGGADDMTTAFTYRAAKRLAAPAAAFADAEQWSDWIGIVGDVEAHVLGAFQRNETIDADFFNGSGTGPAERLAGIDRHSMFYADRMVVVGVEGEEAIAEEAGWEFVPLEDAASGAGWDLVDPDEDGESESPSDADP